MTIGWIRVVVVALLLVTAGCVGADDALGGEPDAATPDAPDDLGIDRDDAEWVHDGPSVDDRRLIRTGKLELRIEDAAVASREIRGLTRERGGFVSASSQRVHERDNETWRTETLVIRVPTDSFDETVMEIGDLGNVARVETETEDVTEQLVDIDARLANLAAERDRLRALYDEANDTRDVLAVQRELADVQQEIERLEARHHALSQAVALSTITIHLAEDAPAPKAIEVDAWYETGVVAAFGESVDGVVIVARALVVLAAYVAPYALAFGPPVLGAIALFRSRVR